MSTFNYEKYWLTVNGYDTTTGRKKGTKLDYYRGEKSSYSDHKSNKGVTLDEEVTLN